MQNRNYLLMGIIGTMLVVFGAGCNPFQKLEEKAQEKASEVLTEKMLESIGGDNVDIDINSDKENLTVKGDEGQEMSFGEEVALPSDLPSMVKIYPGAKAKAVFKGLSGKDTLAMTLYTKDSAADVIKWYDNEYKSFDQGQVISINGTEMRTFDADDAQIVISVGPGDEDETMITMNYTLNQE